jgi:hypothetical protein
MAKSCEIAAQEPLDRSAMPVSRLRTLMTRRLSIRFLLEERGPAACQLVSRSGARLRG